MAAFETLLANSLELARAVAQDNIVNSSVLSRTHRGRLLRTGWLTPVIRGWYILGRPGSPGESTNWYASYWAFIGQYLRNRFDVSYCLSADSSIDFHLDSNAVPGQLIVMSSKGGSHRLELPHGTSMFIYEAAELPENGETILSIRTMPLALALCRVSPTLFSQEPDKAEIVLRMANVTDVTRILLKGGHTSIAGRLVGAYRFLGDEQAARRIENSMSAAGYRLRTENPFNTAQPVFGESPIRITSPYAARIRAQWQRMREPLSGMFPEAPGLTGNPKSVLKQIEELYEHDAYHSLSIEGYEVTAELVMRVRAGLWNPDASQSDRDQRNAMAVRGYADAFTMVCTGAEKIFNGARPAGIIREGLQDWYRALFSPAVQAGIIAPGDLAGYRDDQVYIQASAHVPPPKGAILDAMDAFFECLTNEPVPIVAAILGHFFFVFIHPFMDGNGRMGRFIMNILLVSAGYRWTIIRSDQERRNTYVQSLERASVQGDILPFAEFIREEMEVEWQ